jgi:hypothetical protein
MRKQVSEKTLEINVCAEMLAIVRTWSGYESSLWIGMKQYEEAVTGLDVFMDNVPDRHFLGLQFKSPHADPPNVNPYHYSVNELQQSKLLRLATGGRSVYYVFPNFNTLERLRSSSPQLIGNTYMVHVDSIGDIGGDRRKRHTVRCYEPSGRVTVSSPVEIQRAPTAETFFSGLGESMQSVAGKEELGLITYPELRSWLIETVLADTETRRVGQLLRGFALLAL